MYLHDSKYSKWYYALMSKALQRQQPIQRTEKHHIVPKSLGGSDKSSNIVHLTCREHFVAHAMLARMTIGNARWKMISALHAMINDSRREERYLPSSRIIGAARAKFAEEVSKRMTGRALSQQTRQKMSASKLGVKPNIETRKKMSLAKLGKQQSEKAKAVRSQAMIDHYKTITADEKAANSAKISSAKKGRSNGHNGMTRSEETKRKMSEARSAYWANKRLRADPAV